MTLRPTPKLLLLGTVLAVACAYIGALLTPIALVRWSFQASEGDALRAMLAMVGVRHLPLFLLAVAWGNLVFALAKSTTLTAVGAAAMPYLLYVLVTAIHESLGVGEPAWSWVTYEPAYFIWPHFVAVPGGLWAASRMVARRGR